MTITFLGSAGIGLVWGWLVGNVMSHGVKDYLRVIGILIASVVVAAPVFFFAGFRNLLVFTVSTLFTLWVRTWWSRELRQRSEGLTL